MNFINKSDKPSLMLSLAPIILLLASLVTLIAVVGASSVQDYSYIILLAASAVAIILSLCFTRKTTGDIVAGIKRSSSQILSTVPILVFIGTLSATWMLSGVVPTFISYGLHFLNPTLFLVTCCVTCAVISVVTGSSWTTVATIGVAFMGIGEVMGYSQAWIAGAIISGAYFGDKVSPLSDTTVLASSSGGVELFTHIRFLMLTTIPALVVALIVYLLVGFSTDVISAGGAEAMSADLESTFNITPWLMLIPAVTVVMIGLRMSTWLTLVVGSLAGLLGVYVFQPQIVSQIADNGFAAAMNILLTETSLVTGNELLDSLVSTGGVAGMLPTVWLVLSAMVFGGVLIGTGMLRSIGDAFTHRLHSSRNVVGATVGSGLFLNACTGDQYLSIIICGNIYRDVYSRCSLKPQVLTRALEDSVSVTSVLIPWNSCGITQSTVLGVATLAYLPCCIFNLMSPLMSLMMAWVGWRVRTLVPEKVAA